MSSSSVKSLWRIVYRFARPYTFRLMIGVLAGALVGGSVFGLLRSSVSLFVPFEIEKYLGGGSDETAEKSSAPVDNLNLPPGAPEPEELEESRLDKILAYAERFGFEPVDKEQALTWKLMLVGALGVLVFIGVRMVALITNRYCLRWVGARVVVDIRSSLFECLQSQSLSFFNRTDVGNLISRCTYDTARIEGAIARTVSELSQAPFIILGAFFFAFQYARENELGKTVLTFAILVPLMVGPIIILGRIIKRYVRHALKRISGLVSRMQENLTCIQVVKAYNMEAYELARFKRLSERYFKAVVRAVSAEVVMTPVMEFATAGVLCLFLVVCYFRQIPVSRVFPMALAGYFVYRPMKQLARINTTIQRSAAAAERILELLDTDTSLPVPDNPVTLEAFEDAVRFEHVSFRYGDDGKPVLHDICLEVPKGSVVAFVGETGSGKTTIVNLLARFYDPTAGAITIDGYDLREVDPASLRRLIGFVTQETILFNDTIGHNIAYGTPEATEEAITEAARKANAHGFIMGESAGYDRAVGAKGMMLSGGQRQRVAIARAILKNPPILILDEATSALDTATEQLVQEAINRVMADRTVFAIAHRLSTIRHADVICVLDDGRIIERGTHQELYEKGGRYRELCDLQFS